MGSTVTFIEVPATLTAPAIASLSAQVAALRPGTVAVLRGSPQVFCSGMDLGVAMGQDEAQLRRGLQSYADLLLALRSAPCALIAAVEGNAFGGGVGLAAACDLVLASRSARFGLPEALHGFYPAIVFAVLAERVTPHQARQLALLCESVDAEEALRIGLADKVADPEHFHTAVQRQARKFQRAAPAGVMGIKQHAPHLAALRWALAQGMQASLTSLMAPGVAEALAQEVAA